MNSLNSVLIEGNLTRDPLLSETPRGTAVCNFSVATNRYYRQDEQKQQEVSFLDVETWAKLAERCADELTKGRGVRVVGRLRQDRWEDAEGKKRSRVKIVAEHVEFRPERRQDSAADLEAEGTDEHTLPETEKEEALVF
ncbi:MAG: single-stranded DNA-binding protein [Spirochaetales bacterium]